MSDMSYRDARDTLRRTAVVFLVALAVHGADHARRGILDLPPLVFWAGNAQTALALVTVVLVWRDHRWAPAAAVAIGFASAIGFTLAHLLPDWGAFSDAFLGAPASAHVTAFSWFAALFEIAADLAFGVAGLRVLKRDGLVSLARRSVPA